jgi:hypothetical protein
LMPAGSLLRFTAEEFAAMDTILVLTPGASVSAGGVSLIWGFTAECRRIWCRVLSVAVERISDRDLAQSDSPQAASSRTSAKDNGRGWVWWVLAAATLVGVGSVLAAVLIG